MNGYIFRGSNFTIFLAASLHGRQLLKERIYLEQIRFLKERICLEQIRFLKERICFKSRPFFWRGSASREVERESQR